MAAFDNVETVEVEVIRKTSGLSNGHRTPEEVQEIFGVNVHDYPQLFHVTETGLVVKQSRHEQLFQQHLQSVGRNWQALGIKSSQDRRMS